MPIKRKCTVAFDESGPAAIVEPEVYAQPDREDEARIRLEAMAEIFEFLDRGTEKQIGRRVIVLSHALRNGKQRDLAKRLGVGEARVSQILKFLRDENPRWAWV